MKALVLVVLLMASSVARADIIYTNLGPGGTYNSNTFNVVRGATAQLPFGSSDQANSFSWVLSIAIFTSAQLSLDFVVEEYSRVVLVPIK